MIYVDVPRTGRQGTPVIPEKTHAAFLSNNEYIKKTKAQRKGTV